MTLSTTNQHTAVINNHKYLFIIMLIINKQVNFIIKNILIFKYTYFNKKLCWNIIFN